MGSSPVRLDAALDDVRRLYVETAPFIYFIEENPLYIARMDQIMAAIQLRSIQGVCSVVTLTEVLPVPLKAENSALVQAYEAILLNSREFECVPVDRRTAITAANLRAQYELKTPDALHVAAALEANCDAFLTNDKGILRVRELRVLVLEELELDLPER